MQSITNIHNTKNTNILTSLSIIVIFKHYSFIFINAIDYLIKLLKY
jgi:hypothetical protein